MSGPLLHCNILPLQLHRVCRPIYLIMSQPYTLGITRISHGTAQTSLRLPPPHWENGLIIFKQINRTTNINPENDNNPTLDVTHLSQLSSSQLCTGWPHSHSVISRDQNSRHTSPARLHLAATTTHLLEVSTVLRNDTMQKGR